MRAALAEESAAENSNFKNSGGNGYGLRLRKRQFFESVLTTTETTRKTDQETATTATEKTTLNQVHSGPKNREHLKEAEMRQAAEIIREVFKLGVILVADSGYRRKSLLHWLKKEEKMDFVIRLEGKLLIKAGRSKGLLSKLSVWWPKRFPIQWREKSKKVLLSDVSARQISVKTESKEKFSLNAVCLTPAEGDVEPMFLATTLPIESREDLTMIVRLYSWRWGIETFFWKFKQALGAKSWRVFSCWQAIDRLLAAAHMAYLVLVLLMEFAKRGKTAALRELLDGFEELLYSRFARPREEMTLGRFLRLLAMDFPGPRVAGVGL